MNELSIFAIQLVIALTMSIIVLSLIKPYLKDVLKDTCGTEHSAEFWARFTQLMMVIAPLVIVIFFSGFQSSEQILTQPAYILKQTLLQTLVGELIGLALVGRVIYRSIEVTIELQRSDISHKITTSDNIAKA